LSKVLLELKTVCTVLMRADHSAVVLMRANNCATVLMRADYCAISFKIIFMDFKLNSFDSQVEEKNSRHRTKHLFFAHAIKKQTESTLQLPTKPT